MPAEERERFPTFFAFVSNTVLWDARHLAASQRGGALQRVLLTAQPA